MDLSLSIFDYDFGTGFDDFGIGAFDDFGADFQRAFDFDFGTTFDAGFSNFEGSVTAEFDDESIGDWSGGSGRPRQTRRRVRRANRVYRIESVTTSIFFGFFVHVCHYAKFCFSDGSLFCLLVHIKRVFFAHVRMCTLEND